MLATADEAERVHQTDRREKKRFPLGLGLQLQSLWEENGPVLTGRTLNMSSRGVLFSASQEFRVGQPLKATIEWPLGDIVHPYRRKCEISGWVVRTDPDGTAVLSIERYEFTDDTSRMVS